MAVRQYSRIKRYQVNPFSVYIPVYMYSLQLQNACTYNTVGMPGKGNKGITPSPNNAHTSPKKICICTFSMKLSQERGGSRSFSPHFESFIKTLRLFQKLQHKKEEETQNLKTTHVTETGTETCLNHNSFWETQTGSVLLRGRAH